VQQRRVRRILQTPLSSSLKVNILKPSPNAVKAPLISLSIHLEYVRCSIPQSYACPARFFPRCSITCFPMGVSRSPFVLFTRILPIPHYLFYQQTSLNRQDPQSGETAIAIQSYSCCRTSDFRRTLSSFRQHLLRVDF